jgi:hypothetical protein
VDDSTTKDVPTPYRSPPRILIPKLVQSRDNWKAKANQRSGDLKKAQIRNRDLTLSRDRWKQRALAADQEILALRQQLQQQLDPARIPIVPALHEAQKNSGLPLF